MRDVHVAHCLRHEDETELVDFHLSMPLQAHSDRGKVGQSSPQQLAKRSFINWAGCWIKKATSGADGQ